MARARKSLGQNFLVDPNLQRKIVSTLGAGPEDRVLEIGPGRGALTDHLAGRVAHLTLVELDGQLADALEARYAGRPDVQVIHDDVLSRPLGERVSGLARLLVVGNIPYNVTTPILFHLLARPRPARIVLMVQAEVACRIVATAGSRAYGPLAVGVGSVARARRCFDVPRTVFRPVPGVDSSVVEIVPFRPPRGSAAEELRLRVLTRSLFQWRRKQLGTTLRRHPQLRLPAHRVGALLDGLGLDPTRRPETIPLETLEALARALGPDLARVAAPEPDH